MAPKMDEQYKGDHNRTYAISRNKLEHIKGQRKMERLSYSRLKSKWAVKLKKKCLY